MNEEQIKLLKVAGIAWVGGALCGAGVYNYMASRALKHMITSNKLMYQVVLWCLDEGFELPTAEARRALVEKMEYVSIATAEMASDLGHEPKDGE
jgi:hypothetical protein